MKKTERLRMLVSKWRLLRDSCRDTKIVRAIDPGATQRAESLAYAFGECADDLEEVLGPVQSR